MRSFTRDPVPPTPLRSRWRKTVPRDAARPPGRSLEVAATLEDQPQKAEVARLQVRDRSPRRIEHRRGERLVEAGAELKADAERLLGPVEAERFPLDDRDLDDDRLVADDDQLAGRIERDEFIDPPGVAEERRPDFTAQNELKAAHRRVDAALV